MSNIAFNQEFSFSYGEVSYVSPLIRRVVANNPGPFTYTGTGVYIIGRGDVAVIDPGPDCDIHFQALLDALKGETVTHVLVTHHHMDHSPLAKPLARHFGAKVHGFGMQASVPVDGEVRLEAGDDLTFQPDINIKDGWTAKGSNWTIKAIATPGHTSNHMSYALLEEKALFCGDHIMGWSTTVISPPDGNMGDYLRSLEKVRDAHYDVLYPTHGAPIADNVDAFVQSYIDHRLQREQQIIDELNGGTSKITDIVANIYASVDKKLHPAAAHSVLAHMIHLVEQGRVKCSAEFPNLRADYWLA